MSTTDRHPRAGGGRTDNGRGAHSGGLFAENVGAHFLRGDALAVFFAEPLKKPDAGRRNLGVPLGDGLRADGLVSCLRNLPGQFGVNPATDDADKTFECCFAHNAPIVNYELTKYNPQLSNSWFTGFNFCGMQLETMADRIRDAAAPDNGHDIARRLTLRGFKVSPASVYKWLGGGNISEPLLLAFCDEYRCEPAWIRYGIGRKSGLSEGQEAVLTLMEEAPAVLVQNTFDFMGYQIEASPFDDVKKTGKYLRLIDKIKNDRKNRPE